MNMEERRQHFAARDAKVVQLRKEGKQIKEICRLMGDLTPARIHQILRKAAIDQECGHASEKQVK